MVDSERGDLSAHPRPAASRRRRERGLTLLEILIASALLGLIAVIGIGLLRSTLAAMQEGVERSVQAGRAQAALSMLVNELRQSGRNDPDVSDDSQLALAVALERPGQPVRPNWIAFRRAVGTDEAGKTLWSPLAHVFVQLDPAEGTEPDGDDDDGDGMVDELLLQRLDGASGQLVTLLTDVESFWVELQPDGRLLTIGLSIYVRTERGGLDTLSLQTAVVLRNR